MKLNLLIKPIVVLAVFVATCCCTSQVRADLVNVDFTGGSIVYGNYYVGPYNFLLSQSGSTQSVALVCMDFTNEISGGETWQATISTFNDISLTRNPNTISDYEEAGWLYDYGVSNPSQWGPVNYAIWSILAPTQTQADSGWSSSAATLLSEAQSQTFTNGEFANLAILTPTTPGPQEFIGVIPGYTEPPTSSPNGTPTPAPEPANYLAVSAAGAAVWALIKRRRTA